MSESPRQRWERWLAFSLEKAMNETIAGVPLTRLLQKEATHVETPDDLDTLEEPIVALNLAMGIRDEVMELLRELPPHSQQLIRSFIEENLGDSLVLHYWLLVCSLGPLRLQFEQIMDKAKERVLTRFV